ncbi:MAG: hypothetical protein M5U28_12030 [Sandaracinaceae bacterium]|nr:hypothetical protein [Sandaracinaceae bacterium]
MRDDGCPDIDLGSTLGSPAFHGTFVPRLCGPRRGSCGGAGSELTFRWVAPSDGMYYFSTLDTLGRGETFDTVLYLLDGGCTGPEIACNDDLVLGMMRLSELTVWLRAGQEIAIVLDSYLVGERGLFTVNIEPR